MKVIITFTFCCDNLWKSKFMALEKPGKLGEFFFSYFVTTLPLYCLCGRCFLGLSFYLFRQSSALLCVTAGLSTCQLLSKCYAFYIVSHIL